MKSKASETWVPVRWLPSVPGTWGLRDMWMTSRPPGLSMCGGTSLAERITITRPGPSVQQPHIQCVLFGGFNGALAPAVQRQAIIGGGPLSRVKAHVSENVVLSLGGRR